MKDMVNKAHDDVAKYYELADEVENDFSSLTKALTEADDAVRVAFQAKSEVLYDEWRYSLKVVSDEYSNYNKRMEAIDMCVKILEFTDFVLKQ